MHPACETYLNFYSALSYESLARAMHNCATNKIPLFELAQGYYIAALQSLAAANSFSDEHIPSAITRDSIFEMLADHGQRHKGGHSRPMSASSASSVGTVSIETTPSRPSSASSLGSTPSQAALPATLILKPEPTLASPTSPNSTDKWLLASSKAKYNAHLSSLRNQLEYHIQSVQALSALAVRNQQMKALSAAPASYWVLPTGTMSEEEKRQRIREGRARQWKRKSLFSEDKADRIKALCEQAIRDL